MYGASGMFPCKPEYKDALVRYDAAMAEITQLRAELEQERELADRLADTGENVIIAIGMGWDLDGVIEAYQEALTAHATRRNK